VTMPTLLAAGQCADRSAAGPGLRIWLGRSGGALGRYHRARTLWQSRWLHFPSVLQRQPKVRRDRFAERGGWRSRRWTPCRAGLP
jgi:hypothetical protein